MSAIPASYQRIQVGQSLEPIEVKTLSHGVKTVPAAQVVHLQFRRFAGCPICNRHLHAFRTKQGLLEAAGVQTVAFFHSSEETMRPYQGDLPFAVVADPTREWYRRFAVETSLLGTMHPAAMAAAVSGLFSVKSNPLKGEGGMGGLPADFLIGPDAKVLAVHYGAHADDSWSVEQVIELSRAAAQTV